MAEKKISFSAKPKPYLNLIVLKYRMLNKKNLLKFFARVVTFFTDPYKGTSVGQGQEFEFVMFHNCKMQHCLHLSV